MICTFECAGLDWTWILDCHLILNFRFGRLAMTGMEFFDVPAAPAQFQSHFHLLMQLERVQTLILAASFP